ncbi:serine acetyltransferase [Sphingomonas cavernae]|uniref:Serine acetyltransferase n=2 Tax=Sphingomonas cavernae TaxID=2320861 RepID=A0A418W823_9SPHN|nr:serine acetyltransferase [Sphingomonas cavernae]
MLHDIDARAQAPFPGNLGNVVARLREARQTWRGAHWRHAEHGAFGFPARRSLDRIMGVLCAALFPLRLGPPELNPGNEDAFVEATLESALSQLAAQIRLELHYSDPAATADRIESKVQKIIADFSLALPELRGLIDSDIEAAYAGDPAARSVDEVLLCYPCAIAVIHHRLAHRLYRLGAPLVARIISEVAHSRTGIDIHPGAQIGRSFFIDHGTGVVIGETAIIGDRVKLYQAVTLGARNFPLDDEGAIARGAERHPIVEDDVVIYAGATILGRVTIGRGSTIGGNIWLTQSVPAGSHVRQAHPNLTIAAHAGDEDHVAR